MKYLSSSERVWNNLTWHLKHRNFALPVGKPRNTHLLHSLLYIASNAWPSSVNDIAVCDVTSIKQSASCWNKGFRCYEVKIEESKKASSCRESNPGHLACAPSSLPLNYDNWTTISHHNPLYILHRWYWMPQLHTWMPLSMCHQNSIRGRPEIYLHQERTHAEWFCQSKCLELLPHVGMKRI